MIYIVKFLNAPTQVVRATNRSNAITQAVAKTRGYLTANEQRKNVLSCKLEN